MQLEELQQQWQRLDQKLDLSIALQTELVRQAVMQPARRRMNRLSVWPVIDTVFDFADLPAAMDHLGAGRSRGKIVLTVKPVPVR